MRGLKAYPAVDVIGLRSFPKLAVASAMNHTSVHGDGVGEDALDELLSIRLPHGSDAPLGEGEIDGLGEIQRNRVWITQICKSTCSVRMAPFLIEIESSGRCGVDDDRVIAACRMAREAGYPG